MTNDVYRQSNVRHDFRSIDALLSPFTPNEFIDQSNCFSGHFQCLEFNHNRHPPLKISSVSNKTKGNRTAFSDSQRSYLERFYIDNRYPDSTDLKLLSDHLLLDEKVIRVWFQNKRSRDKIRGSSISFSVVY